MDSAVAAVLLHEAIGEQLTCIFVDHGLLRLNEAEQVVETFRDRFNIRLVHRDASDLFLGALQGVTDPETKRKTIGGCSSRCSRKKQRRSAGRIFLRRARCIRT